MAERDDTVDVTGPGDGIDSGDAPVRDEEEPLDPQRVIIDPHHHLWDHSGLPQVVPGTRPFLVQDMLATIRSSGHNVTHTVYVECHSMYRQDGPIDMRPVGETEFANGMAAMAASGRYGNTRVAHGIVGNADLRLGTRVRPVLEAHLAAGNGRLRGVRMASAYVPGTMFGFPTDAAAEGVLRDPALQAGARLLPSLGLTLDLWCFHTQLAQFASLASACPETLIVLDHLGTPALFNAPAHEHREIIASWRSGIIELARRPNVRIKLGGLASNFNQPLGGPPAATSSIQLARDWKVFIETCIEAFGAARCMFESNYPTDTLCTYGAMWNAFKRITAGCSEAEKERLFSGTAREVYRLN
ncbi:MAG TPA: amidohydrolase family protein [Steroidobacteraceae bacterium]|nr:amidohydrolase family protein [Steroidobacteraceae bacterium]